MEKKVILIAGGSGGIGAGLVKSLSSENSIVCYTYNSGADVAAAMDEQLGRERVRSYRCDVANREETSRVVREVEDEFGKIDVLINAFGITRDKSLALMSDDEWGDVISINLNGIYNFTRSTIVGMMKRRSGSIINFSSVSGITGMAGQTNYSATKAAIIGFSKSLAKEASPRGVRVNVIAPGFIETAMTDSLPADYLENMKKRIPLGRIGQVDDLVGIARLLAGEESSYITGQVFVVDGGMAI